MRYIGIIIVIAVIAIIAFIVFPSKEGDESYFGNFINTKQQADEDIAKIKCVELCQAEVLNRPQQEFEQGPCLSGQIIPDWVCDEAHSPRREVDNDPANQCPEFKTGQAHHFIEVDTNCNFIKSY